MESARLAYTTLKKSNNSFSLEGMIEPVIYNEGQTLMFVNLSKIRPGEFFNAGFKGMANVGTVDIRFEDEAGKINLAVIHYGTADGLHTDPATGNVLGTKSKAILKSVNSSC